MVGRWYIYWLLRINSFLQFVLRSKHLEKRSIKEHRIPCAVRFAILIYIVSAWEQPDPMAGRALCCPCPSSKSDQATLCFCHKSPIKSWISRVLCSCQGLEIDSRSVGSDSKMLKCVPSVSFSCSAADRSVVGFHSVLCVVHRWVLSLSRTWQEK